MSHLFLADSDLYHGRNESVANHVDQAINLNGESPKAHFLRSHYIYDQNKYGQTLHALESYGALVGWDALMHAEAAHCHQAQGDPKKTEFHAEKALSSDPDSRVALAFLALCLEGTDFSRVKTHIQASSDRKAAYSSILERAVPWERPEVV